MLRSRTLSLLTVVLVCLVIATITASAQGRKPYTEEDSFTITNEPMAPCGDFDILLSGSGTVKFTTFFDGDGDPIRLTLKGRSKGTMTNSVTGYSIDDSPSIANFTVDLIKGTETHVGATFTVTVPGTGAVLIDAGRIVFDTGGNPLFIAGPHLPPDQQFDILCQALR